ncbi:glycosyltransferase family 39 protein [Candidatus Gottesmanbacteria bacterium]|nr:glycosyltransferase family 39 protein [Candidatus Gottesmanbacteria bacterium]
MLNKYTLGAIFILILTFLITRLVNLTIIPIFTDEAIYLRWAQLALGDASMRFISLIDGKQPLFIWFSMVAMKWIEDPLVAGRLVSIFSGLFGVIGMFFLGWEASKKISVGFMGSLLYIVIPIFLVYDRLALMDGLLTSLGIWSLWLSLIFIRTLRLDVALILGMVIGTGLLTKSSATFYLLFLPLTLILFDFKKKFLTRNLLKWLGLYAIIIFISQTMYLILRLSPFFHMIAQKDHNFILNWNEFLQNPFMFALGNLNGLTIWLGEYLTWPVFILIILSLSWLIKKNFRLGLVLLLWFLVPFTALSFFGKIIYPRYLLFMTPSILIPLAIFLADIFLSKKLVLLKILFLLSFIPALWFDILILSNPIKAPFPGADRDQLLDQWPSGYGVQEVIKVVKSQAQEKPVFLATEGTFGLFPAAFELYLKDEKNVTMKGYWPVNELPLELLTKAKTTTTFIVFKEKEEIPPDWPLELVLEIPRGSGKTYLRMFEIKPKDTSDGGPA